ncbi:biotin/lipoyl-containing protein, partial [Xylella fastidiosa]|uniref:biotin/lipoyl-containing protein n=1 Tax=Xylella fastidiosa TaxID=2371 RepID=UPI002ED82451
MTVIEIKVPDIGDYSKVPVIEVLVTVGDHVVKNQGILTLESDKATLEVPSMNNGVVKELKVNVGDLLSQGDVILLLETEDTTAPPSPSNTATSDTTSPR